MPVASPEMVVLEVFPFIAPGLIVQFPEGKPFKTTLPVASEHVGCVMVPTEGAVGVTGCVLITALAEAGEVHPTELVTVYVYVPAAMPDIVLLLVFPAIAPGFMVQFPAGKPFNTTLPVATAQVG